MKIEDMIWLASLESREGLSAVQLEFVDRFRQDVVDAWYRTPDVVKQVFYPWFIEVDGIPEEFKQDFAENVDWKFQYAEFLDENVRMSDNVL